jgi:NAD-dependent SIR2 family protein deacetylase
MHAADLEALADLLDDGGVVVLSGAGLSTESGIPDYRGPSGVARRATPMSLQSFTGSREARQRYWARSHLGWGLNSRAQPNDGHRAVAALQSRGLLAGIVTQNVDGLHQGAGARATPGWCAPGIRGTPRRRPGRAARTAVATRRPRAARRRSG